MSSGLAERLKNETRQLHATVERQGLMGELLRGAVELPQYCQLLRNLQAIYSALESGLARHQADVCVAKVHSPHLQRAAALEADLDELAASEWRQGALVPAAAQYVQRLRSLRDSATEARLLIAHAYVRYLGDLAGGQMLGRLVSSRFALAPGFGTRFYDFGPADAVAGLQRAFRDGLATMPVSAEDVERIVAEARTAFLRHGELFDQLLQPPRAGLPA